ncbi:MAG: flagellar export protein FliJ [Lachnospiraceae bacterium]|nr:flagellar export protein FliJ [Lachnospiraceae bacterium]
MARFRYRMQNILNIKLKLEDQEKQNFAMARNRLTEEEEILKGYQEKRDYIAREGVRMRTEKIDLLKIKENTALASYYDDQIRSQKVKVATAQKNLETARKRMQNAITERKIHEKLRENAFEKFVKEEAMNEAKEIDELTSYKYGLKQKQSEV